MNQLNLELPAVPISTSDNIIEQLILALSSRYVRRENRFFNIERPNQSLSNRDVQQAFLHQLPTIVPTAVVTSDMLKRVFFTAIEQKQTDTKRTIPVWGGTIQCVPGCPERIIWQSTGTVVLNSWKPPEYRASVDDPDSTALLRFIVRLFPLREELIRVLDWLAWCLQNEAEKPAWALMLYSREKGTGKSTFCDIARHLFGHENTATQNNVDKLTSKFNGTVLGSKLIISEEVTLRPDSTQSNTLKTYITDKWVLSERKGFEAERLPLISCFLFTSNHLPTWLEEGERRYYVIDTGHSGHASGPEAAEFSALVGEVAAALNNPANVRALYEGLMSRKLNAEFNPHSLDSVRHGTALMKRLQSSSRATNLDQLDEFLNREGRKVMTQTDVKVYVTKEFHVSGNSVRHLMTEVGWTQYTVKWGGVDYARAIWARPGYTVVDGNIIGSDGSIEAVCDHLALAGTQ